MIDLKILGAGFVALIVVSSFFAGNIGFGELINTVVDHIKGWLEGSPFEGFITLPSQQDARSEQVEFTLYPKGMFSIKPDSLVDISVAGIDMNKFSGKIDINFTSGKIMLTQSGSEFTIKTPLQITTVRELEMQKIAVNGKVEMTSGNWEYNSENAGIEVFGFAGTMEIYPSSVKFRGNATKLVRN